MKSILEKQENLDVRQLEVIDIEVEDGKVDVYKRQDRGMQYFLFFFEILNLLLLN